MSYASMAALAKDADFQDRVAACVTIECQSNLGDVQHPDQSNLAYDVLRGQVHVYEAFTRMVSQTPGVAEAAGDSVDQSLVSDDLIQAAVVDLYPVVAGMYYNPDGSPWTGALGLPEPPLEEIPPIDEIPPPPPPEVTSFTPTQGGADILVTISGVSLTGTTDVTISTPCGNLAVVDDATVTCTVPNPRPSKGFYDVLVTVDGNVITAPGQFQVT
jgi:hypothetical protein